MALLDPRVSDAIGILQSLDDAIEFRLGRLSQPCRDCAGGRKCAVHSFDERLVVRYQARYATAFKSALADLDPDVIEQVIGLGAGVPPATFLLGAAILTRLLGIGADGLAATEPVGQTVTGHRCRPMAAADERGIRHGRALVPRHCGSARTRFLPPRAWS